MHLVFFDILLLCFERVEIWVPHFESADRPSEKDVINEEGPGGSVEGSHHLDVGVG